MTVKDKLLENPDTLRLIESYILKADDDLKTEFENNDIVDAAGAVEFTNKLADAITELEDSYVNDVASAIRKPDKVDLKQGFSIKNTLEDKMYQLFLKQINETSLETQYADIFHEMFTDYFDNTLTKVSSRIDNEITITDYSKRTKEWLSSWSHQLAELTDISNKEALVKILDSCKDTSKTVEDTAELIAELGVREAGHSARRFAITETYRINNYANMEAMLQNPAAKGKTWEHKGSTKNARKYHLALDGVTIAINKPFELRGADGKVYYPMAPHDSCLPAGEVVHCGCKIRAKTSKEILGKPIKDKELLQKKRIKAADDDWEKEFNKRNKKAADIDFEKVKIDWVKKKTPEEQIKYFGGGHSGKARKALIDAGVVTDDKSLNTLYNRNDKGKRVLKTLKELEDDGIMTVRNKDFNHVIKGEIKSPNEHYPNGRLTKGGHSKSSFDICEKLGLGNVVEGKYSNGVKYGSIPTSTTRSKKNGSHTWFPDDWNDDKILCVWTKVKNRKAEFITDKINDSGDFMGKIYNCDGIAIIYRQDSKGDSFYPVKNQNDYIKGVKLNDK